MDSGMGSRSPFNEIPEFRFEEKTLSKLAWHNLIVLAASACIWMQWAPALEVARHLLPLESLAATLAIFHFCFRRLTVRTSVDGLHVKRGLSSRTIAWRDVAEYSIGPASDKKSPVVKLFSAKKRRLVDFTVPASVVAASPGDWDVFKDCLERKATKVAELHLPPFELAQDKKATERMAVVSKSLYDPVMLLHMPDWITYFYIGILAWCSLAAKAAYDDPRGGYHVAAMLCLPFLAVAVTAHIRWKHLKVRASEEGLEFKQPWSSTVVPWTNIERVRVETFKCAITYRNADGHTVTKEIPTWVAGEEQVRNFRELLKLQAPKRGFEYINVNLEEPAVDSAMRK